MVKKSNNTITVTQYVDLIGGNCEMTECIKDGDTILVNTPPGCWGPMITPSIRSGHEVAKPTRLLDAVPGDAVALFLDKVEVLSEFAASGTGRQYPDNFGKDPSIHAICPHCHTEYPETILVGTGENAVRCKKCQNPIIPQTLNNGYTTVYDKDNGLAVTVPPALASEIAQQTLNGEVYLPKGSHQHLATILGAADLTDLLIRQHPMVGNLGCSPAIKIPSAKNSGDLLDSLNRTELYEKVRPCDLTDGHLDINNVVQGSIVLSPVLIEGAGIYVGDVHLTQGDGELAGHTLDICASVSMHVHLLKGLTLEGPIILPPAKELDSRFSPFSAKEYSEAANLLKRHGYNLVRHRYPVQIVGSGNGLNDAIDCAVGRASRLTGISPDEIKNLATVGGGIKIGRTTGTVCLTLMLPEEILDSLGLLELIRLQYD